MLYFLVKKGNELQIMRVSPANEETFRLFYDQQILVEGKSTEEVQLQMHQLPLIMGYGFY